MTKAQVEIFCDGSSLGNPGAGGYAALLISAVNGKKTEKMVTGNQANATNNQMELRAAILGLSSLKKACVVKVHTDSNYVVKGMTEWLFSWKKKNFKNSKNQPVANQELWLELEAASKKHEVSWHWVKAHNGHRENEMVDEAARNAASSL